MFYESQQTLQFSFIHNYLFIVHHVPGIVLWAENASGNNLKIPTLRVFRLWTGENRKKEKIKGKSVRLSSFLSENY